MSFTFSVNGKSQTVDAPADMPLLWVIRDVLNLKGAGLGADPVIGLGEPALPPVLPAGQRDLRGAG